MKKIDVFQNGSLVTSLELNDGGDYYAGRAEENDIVLPKEKGVSRRHLHIFQEEGEWAVELVSKFGTLTVENQNIESFIIEDGMSFQVSPFNFVYSEVSNEIAVQNRGQAAPSKTPKSRDNDELDLDIDIDNNGNGMEVTATGNKDLTAFLKISYAGGTREILRLEGNFWAAGRDQNCEIILNDSFMSRNHFEISKTTDKFFVRDLESMNTTHLNGTPLEPLTDTPLESGDEISIQSISILFEVHNDNFEELSVPSPMALVPHNNFNPNNNPMVPSSLYQGPHSNLPMPYQQPGLPSVELMGNDVETAFEKLKKNKVRMAIIALIPLIIIGALMDSGNNGDKNENKSLSSVTKKLSKEQLALVKDSLLLAQKHYVEHRYNLCVEQVSNIHDLVPSYQNSMELSKLCNNAAELEKIQKDKDKLRATQLKNEAIIADVVEQCRIQLKQSTTLQELKNCLSEAVDIDPLHPKVTALQDVIEQRELKKKMALQQKGAYRLSVRRGLSLYKAAKSASKRKRWKDAIKKYNTYLASSYPDPNQLKSTAKRELASVKSKFKGLISENLKSCKSNFETEAYKLSIEECKKVLKIVPRHTEARKIRSRSTRALNKMMKLIYEDANMEESFGNTALASKKWNQIVTEDVKGGLYYRKAVSKLKRLGD